MPVVGRSLWHSTILPSSTRLGLDVWYFGTSVGMSAGTAP